MLPATHRLRQFRDFQRVYRSGRSVACGVIRLSWMPAPNAANSAGHSRFGVVVPNKLIKKATDRNTKKRQIRAALRTVLGQVAAGHDIVVSGQAGLPQADYARIAEDLTAALVKARLL